MKKDTIFATRQEEGMERPMALVIIQTPTQNFNYLCHSWGIVEGHRFIDLVTETHVEFHGPEPNLILHVPPKGFTFEADGNLRELQTIERKVICQ